VKLQGEDYKVKFDRAFKVAPTVVVSRVYMRGASYPETITKITKEGSVVTTEFLSRERSHPARIGGVAKRCLTFRILFGFSEQRRMAARD
jgi:hypothetical protein